VSPLRVTPGRRGRRGSPCSGSLYRQGRSFTLFSCISVSVYVKVFTNSPFLVCMDLGLSQEEIIDPTYLWIGPDGKNLQATGKLMVKRFKESMSGAYTCTLSHKIIETDAQDETEVSEAEPDYTYKISVRFTTKECKLVANNKFFEELKRILDNILSDLACHVIEPSYKCHSVKIPKQSLLHELFITFQGNRHNCFPFLARDRIEEFFNKQTYALKHDFQALPTIHYVDHSFEVTRIDSCRPGFGKNDITHNDCASCCVVCDPGTYSPNNEVTCRTCVRTQIKQYGAKSC
uniref:Zona pellucida binding protein 2 n=1 Tax=Nothoprocta perdicaria TaxID=30464 RepID=A0A8C6ZJ09_NOTPE